MVGVLLSSIGSLNESFAKSCINENMHMLLHHDAGTTGSAIFFCPLQVTMLKQKTAGNSLTKPANLNSNSGGSGMVIANLHLFYLFPNTWGIC